MTFKLIALVLTCILQFSCSDFLKGKPKKEETIEVNKESLSCLSQVSVEFKNFLNSEISETKMDQTFNCIDQALNEFQAKVKGRAQADSFTNEELLKIFNIHIKDT